MTGQRKLLREWYAVDYSPSLLKEEREKSGKLFLSGVIQRADVKNQNKRVYPFNILRREMENYSKAVKENRAVGELDHPESSTVSLKNVSHVLREFSWDGTTVMGRIEVLGGLPMGKILEGLVESGVRIGISSRGVGSTESTNEGTDVVNSDYQIITFDVVSEPSTPGAYLSEGLDRELSPPKLIRADRIFRALNDIVLR